ncbi:MAG: UvrD-helicase domain-containing protein, partial [Clostridia bacterium]|nr:UvrD-helicase domain-containing protein [Clostridia bacterium]
FVDEYQDVNPIQDEIISAVAGGDLFCVGDVKQAIYGFRGSSSSFFAAKSAAAVGGGNFIVLPDNFRSASAVIKFVNNLFSEIMRPPVCGINYADKHEMRGGALYPQGAEGVAEICRFDGGGQDKKEAEGVYSVEEATSVGNVISAEGRAVLSLVKEALNGSYYDTDSGAMKKVEAGDICVLCRKRSNKNAQSIVRALVSAGYAVAGAAEVNVCERPDIVRILDILSYLENGEQDVPLAAALLSPLGGLTPVQLAKIRVAGGNVKEEPLFRNCVERYAKERDDGLAQRLKLFFERVKKLRTLATCTGAATLIDEIVATGGFASTFDSSAKLAALRCLQREAYSPSGELYLSQFLYKIKLGGNKVLAPSSLAADSIKVMTMHASKGLEFPVVIVADVAAQFKGDSYDEMPFDDEFGFAPKFYGQSTRVYKNTVLRRLIKFRREQEELNNEINLFYVACTRAKYALYVLNSGTERYSKVAEVGATSYAELFDADAFNPRTLDIQPTVEAVDEGARTIDLSRADEKTAEALGEAAFSRYPYALGTELPVKSSASRLIATIEEEGDAPLFGYEITAEKGDGTSIEKGLAYHRFLQLCDFNKRSEREISEELAVFVYNGLMTEAERNLLSVDELVKILSMPAFIRLEGKELFREREFVCRLPSQDYLALRGGENRQYTVGEDDGNGVIMQGAIDLLAVRREGGKVISAEIIDYKYSAGTEEYVKAHYAPQLALYQSVVAKIYGLPTDKVKKTIINIRTLKQTDM